MSIGNREVVCLRIVAVPMNAYSRRGLFRVRVRLFVFGKQSADSCRIYCVRSTLTSIKNGLVLLNAVDAVEYSVYPSSCSDRADLSLQI